MSIILLYCEGCNSTYKLKSGTQQGCKCEPLIFHNYSRINAKTGLEIDE